MQKNNVRSGIRTHASIRRPERPFPLPNGKVCYHLESGALDRSAILTSTNVPLFTVS